MEHLQNYWHHICLIKSKWPIGLTLRLTFLLNFQFSIFIITLMCQCIFNHLNQYSFSEITQGKSETNYLLNVLTTYCVPFKMGFILTFTGISLTLIFHPLHMSVLYRCNRKKKKSKSKSHPLFWDFFHRKQGSSQWQASAVQKRKLLCQNPWNSENKHSKMELAIHPIYKTHLINP